MPDHSWTQVARVTSAKKADSTAEPGVSSETKPFAGPKNAVQDEVVRLFAELRAPLLRYLHFLGLTVGDGEDVIQEAFLALFRHLSAGKPRDNLRGWIFKAARNLALKRIHQAGATTPMAESLQVADSAANPEERAVRKQQGRAIQATIQALSELDRQCLYLRAEGLRYREIASVLDVSLGSVALALGRALAKLARTVQR